MSYIVDSGRPLNVYVNNVKQRTWRISSVSVSSSGAKVKLLDTDVLASSSRALKSLITCKRIVLHPSELKQELNKVTRPRELARFRLLFMTQLLSYVPVNNRLHFGRETKRYPIESGAGKRVVQRCGRIQRPRSGRRMETFDDRSIRLTWPHVISF
jgi:hypothetical protein